MATLESINAFCMHMARCCKNKKENKKVFEVFSNLEVTFPMISTISIGNLHRVK